MDKGYFRLTVMVKGKPRNDRYIFHLVSKDWGVHGAQTEVLRSIFANLIIVQYTHDYDLVPIIVIREKIWVEGKKLRELEPDQHKTNWKYRMKNASRG